ncbi:MAG: hypothetical protein P4L83_14965 [Nevskia sp.]|nr:hypothetical protein [Nevskia sp.]
MTADALFSLGFAGMCALIFGLPAGLLLQAAGVYFTGYLCLVLFVLLAAWWIRRPQSLPRIHGVPRFSPASAATADSPGN